MAMKKIHKKAKISKKSLKNKQENLNKLNIQQKQSLFVGGLTVFIVLALVIFGLVKYQGNNKSFLPNIDMPTSVPLFPTLTTVPLTIPSQTPKKQLDKASSAVPAESDAPAKKNQPIAYKVSENDSLYAIGMRFCNDESEWLKIAETNSIYPPYTISTGDTVIVICK